MSSFKSKIQQVIKDNKFFINNFGFESGIDITNDTQVLYRKNYVIKNIVLKDETSLESDKLTWYGSDKDTVAEGNVKIKKSKDMYELADKCNYYIYFVVYRNTFCFP